MTDDREQLDRRAERIDRLARRILTSLEICTWDDQENACWGIKNLNVRDLDQLDVAANGDPAALDAIVTRMIETLRAGLRRELGQVVYGRRAMRNMNVTRYWQLYELAVRAFRVDDVAPIEMQPEIEAELRSAIKGADAEILEIVETEIIRDMAMRLRVDLGRYLRCQTS